jgi:hypothetical protein
MIDALATYLEALHVIRSSGAAVKETSGYGALANLLDAVGGTLKPKVRCFIHVKNMGAGLPDGGLFTPDQLKNTDEEAPLLGIPLPSRGVIEVKDTGADVDDVAETKQVRLTHMARRIAALILPQPELDRNYATVKVATANWSEFATESK